MDSITSLVTNEKIQEANDIILEERYYIAEKYQKKEITKEEYYKWRYNLHRLIWGEN